MKYDSTRYRRQRALTLVETLVLIWVAVLIGVFLLMVPHQPKESANRTKCINNLRQMGTALVTYETQKGVRCPYGPMSADSDARGNGFGGLYDNGNGVMGDAAIFLCPEGYEGLTPDSPEVGAMNRNPVSCQYLRSWWDYAELQPSTIIAADFQGGSGVGNHAGNYGNFLFKDCHVIGFPFPNDSDSVLTDIKAVKGAADPSDEVYTETGDAAVGSATRTALIYNDR